MSAKQLVASEHTCENKTTAADLIFNSSQLMQYPWYVNKQLTCSRLQQFVVVLQMIFFPKKSFNDNNSSSNRSIQVLFMSVSSYSFFLIPLMNCFGEFKQRLVSSAVCFREHMLKPRKCSLYMLQQTLAGKCCVALMSNNVIISIF